MRRTPAVASLLLLLAVSSVAANGDGNQGDSAGAARNNGYGGGGDAPAGSNGYGGGGGPEVSYTEPAYRKAVDGLDYGYYSESCPKMEEIVGKAVRKAVGADYTLAASIMRLFFHDFAVGGVDGSVLIDVPGHSEKYAEASRTLRGFDVIESIKTELEAACHATVSCADILAAAARDAAAAVGVPYWSLKYGRRDGKESSAEAADRYVPMGGESIGELVGFFQSNGLNVQDLVVLSGAHTIGRATCGAVTKPPGLCGRRRAGTLDRQFGDFLRRKCGAGGDREYVELDGETPTAFDNQYYRNLMRGRGLLDTDQKLLADPMTGGFVKTFANAPSQFFVHQFAQSMRRLGEVQLLTGKEGEVRRKCSAVNY
ncbi:hypothetical protein U9M48_015264 [Paspalum notatum var. saurae]|uniref:Peroxidase n=1 Tax=Paspalum notatum var. saurae TaxID=547442 RepID=A0AAQ3T411_PASNO